MSEVTALVPIAGNVTASTQLEPSTAEQAMWLAAQLVKSGLLGKGVQRPEAAFAVILAGRELGLTAMQSLRSIHIIEGKPILSADLMVALVKRSSLCKSFKLVESTNTVATYVTDRSGEGETRMSFTIEDAKLAGVAGKNNWRTYPAAMLRARCIAQLARVVYPDLLMGVYEQDELAPSAHHTVPLDEASTPKPSDPPQPALPAPDNDEVYAWIARMESAEDVDQLEVYRSECKAQIADTAALLAISKAYAARKQALNA